MSAVPLRIAMWSGPRNISTAMMRSWGNRPDTAVWDEPLYAHYLLHTGIEHPGRDEVVAHHEADWRKVVEQLVGEVPEGRSVFFQKHMTHHLLQHVDRSFLDRVANCFLVRDPREVIVSLAKRLPSPRIEDTGLPQQVEIFEWVRARTGAVPPVVDARDVLEDPRGVLSRLCGALGVSFDDAMLSWPPGRRATDGIWAKHWYDSVERSTSFAPYVDRDEPVPPALRDLHEQCVELYRRLHRHRLRAASRVDPPS